MVRGALNYRWKMAHRLGLRYSLGNWHDCSEHARSREEEGLTMVCCKRIRYIHAYRVFAYFWGWQNTGYSNTLITGPSFRVHPFQTRTTWAFGWRSAIELTCYLVRPADVTFDVDKRRNEAKREYIWYDLPDPEFDRARFVYYDTRGTVLTHFSPYGKITEDHLRKGTFSSLVHLQASGLSLPAMKWRRHYLWSTQRRHYLVFLSRQYNGRMGINSSRNHRHYAQRYQCYLNYEALSCIDITYNAVYKVWVSLL